MTAPTTRIHQSDHDLVAAILAHDRKATARMVELHTDAVHRYVWRRLTPKVEMADDIIQDVFIAAWSSLRSYSGEASLQAWLLGIARNKVEDHYRKALSRPLADLESSVDEMPVADVDLEGSMDAERQESRAALVLTELSCEYAVALRWRYWDGRSAREVAAASDRSEKAVERLLARAREQFKTHWLRMERRKPWTI